MCVLAKERGKGNSYSDFGGRTLLATVTLFEGKEVNDGHVEE